MATNATGEILNILPQYSLLMDAILYEDKKHGEKPPKVPVPTDKFFICHVLFFLLGVCHILPISFLSAANNYWQYKFRNVSDSNQTASNRTFLQTNFASATLIINTIPCLLFGIFNVLFGNKFRIMNRIIITLSIQLVVFIGLTISVEIDTDNFQVFFFILVMLAYATLSGANTVNIVSTMNLFPRFPHEYMKSCLVGEGTAGIVGDLINILAVSIFSNDIINASLMYFICGTSMVILTLILNIVISRTQFFNHCLDSFPQDIDKKLPSKREITEIFTKIRFILVLVSLFVIGLAATHSAVTALVVSEEDENSSSWSKNYFSPVMTFLLTDIGMLIGRMISSYLPIKMSDKLFFIFALIRTVIMVPMVWLCNAQPRKHLPLVFPHDYEYGLILGVFMITNGYIINMASLYIPQKVDQTEADVAYTLFGLGVNIIQTVTSPIGLFIVNIL